jgi:formate dehydrogenase subunit delta
MNIERLVAMANDIAAFFAAEADADAAAEQMAAHLRRYWEPRMRETIRRHAEAGGQGLAETALRAIMRPELFASGAQRQAMS